jgi:hypothetical protein
MNLKLNILALVGKAKEQVFPVQTLLILHGALLWHWFMKGTNDRVDNNATFCCLLSKVQRY